MALKFRSILILLCAGLAVTCVAQDPSNTNAGAKPPRIELSAEVQRVLVPLFESISNAKVSRANVDLLTDALLAGKVVDHQKLAYQIASDGDKFTIYLRESDRRTRLYSNGSETVIALAPDAYTRLSKVLTPSEAVASLPIPMGPYPEPLFSLTLAGVDPNFSLVDGMQSIQWIDNDRFLDRVDAVHLRGVQKDGVTWDFWVQDSDQPRPLRLLIDLTPMLRASTTIQVPDGYSYQLRYDFQSWRMGGEIDSSLFEYQAPKGARPFASAEEYERSKTRHPLLGKPLPTFAATSIDGKPIASKQLRGRVVVIDFWASWCEPCREILPVLKEMTDPFAEQDVVLLTVNVGESKQTISTFLAEQGLELPVLLDSDEKIADLFETDSLPQTVIVGKEGTIESIHVGFVDQASLRQRLKDELEVLKLGGRIATSQP